MTKGNQAFGGANHARRVIQVLAEPKQSFHSGRSASSGEFPESGQLVDDMAR